MSKSPLEERLARLGAELSAREEKQAEGLARAQAFSQRLHSRVAAGLAAFHAAARPGAPHLQIELEDPRCDEKHLHSVQFGIGRGRHRGIVTVKSRGEVTLVGPFKRGKDEGPCKTFPIDDEAAIDAAMTDFLSALIEEAATP